MSPRRDIYGETERLRDRLYQNDLERWADWLRQQDRLRALVPRAIDLLEEQLDARGPEAVKLALALVRLVDVAGAVEKPQLSLLGFVGEAEARARLAGHGADLDGARTLESGS